LEALHDTGFAMIQSVTTFQFRTSFTRASKNQVIAAKAVGGASISLASESVIAAEIVRSLRNHHKRFLNWVDAFWGYDVFIAHRRADAAEYAHKLYEALRVRGISCFIDRAVYGPGDSLTVATQRHVHKSTVFVLLGSPEILSSRKPVDWVEEEVNEYLASHESDPKIIPIDFGETIARAAPTPKSILQRVENFVRIPEALPALAESPSEAVLYAIRGKLDGRRRDRTRVRFFEVAAAVLAVLFAGAFAAAMIAWFQSKRRSTMRHTRLRRSHALRPARDVGSTESSLRLPPGLDVRAFLKGRCWKMRSGISLSRSPNIRRSRS
jgi:hypothetical protein